MPRPPPARARAILAAAAGWWLLIAIVSAAVDRSRGGTGGWSALGDALAAVAGWIPLTLAVFALVWRVPFTRATWRRALAIHAVGAAATIVLRAVYIYAIDPWVHLYPTPPAFATVLLHSVENNLFVYWLFVGVGHAALFAREALDRRRDAAALEIALARAEHAALAATMQPHFLFNTLGAIAELVHRDPDAADRALVQLCALLRRLVDDRRQEVPLADELAFTRDYLAIEELRFGDRLAVRWDLDPALDSVLVPRLSVQPLVENAVRHGLWPTARPGVLTIATRRSSDGRAIITVTDDGAGLATATPHERSLATVRARVERLYGGRGQVELGPASAGSGVRAALVVPASSDLRATLAAPADAAHAVPPGDARAAHAVPA